MVSLVGQSDGMSMHLAPSLFMLYIMDWAASITLNHYSVCSDDYRNGRHVLRQDLPQIIYIYWAYDQSIAEIETSTSTGGIGMLDSGLVRCRS